MLGLGLGDIIRPIVYKIKNIQKQKFECPVCHYQGPFMDIVYKYGIRRHAKCPKCLSFERHRLQSLVLDEVGKNIDFSTLRVLHFAPEQFFRSRFQGLFKEYVTADLYEQNVDYKVDIREIPFDDGEFDMVYASHVLEHIQEDEKAIAEIRRILSPTGIAILPVPIVADKTIEYHKDLEGGHVRAPGPDYFDKYNKHFSRIVRYSSEDFDPVYQPFVYEDRTVWPTEEFPMRQPMAGEKHIDLVPVCYV